MTSETTTPPAIAPSPREYIPDVTPQSANHKPPPPSANCGTVATGLASPSQPTIGSASVNGVADEVLDEMPQFSHFKVLASKDYADKYRKYESEYTQLLMAKYFSGKNIYGGNIFEEKTKMGDEIIMSSRWPCTRSYADPVKCFQEQNDNASASTEKNPCEIPNGDLASEKNS